MEASQSGHLPTSFPLRSLLQSLNSLFPRSWLWSQSTSNLAFRDLIYSGITYGYQNVSFSMEKTPYTKVEALCGLIPIFLFFGEVFILFYFTEWAWKYPALSILLVFPTYCLMTCRHIICSVAKVRRSLDNQFIDALQLETAQPFLVPSLPCKQSRSHTSP